MASGDRNGAGVHAVIVGSSANVRRLDPRASTPSPLRVVDENRTVLDWLLHALAANGMDRPVYVGGYHIQKVMQRYPRLDYRFHEHWRDEGEVAALGLARPERLVATLTMRAGTVCVPDAVARMVGDPERVVVGRAGASADVLWIPRPLAEEAFEVAAALARRSQSADLEALAGEVVRADLPLREQDLGDVAATIDDPAAIARLVFGGKGATLERIAPLVRGARVLDLVRLSVADWRRDPTAAIARVRRALPCERVVVRSSAGVEDGLEESAAGRFASVLDVRRDDGRALAAAIEEVVDSYGPCGRDPRDDDEVLVQPHVAGLAAAGVLLTRDVETGAPYRVLSIDRSGRSDLVTSGDRGDVETHYVARGARGAPAELVTLLALGEELEQLTHLDALDVEFGVDRDGSPYLFQVRPLPARARRLELADEDLAAEIDNVERFLADHIGPHPTLAGDTTVFGSMPDWNPAEMIGAAPRALALSLYQRLIGSGAWSRARAAAGYRDVWPEPLIVSLAGRPYVDVRASLNSFLPAGLPDRVAAPWIDHGLELVRQDPRLHDKLEFAVAVTCADLSPEPGAARMRDAGLAPADAADLDRRLVALTDGALCGRTAPVGRALAAFDELADRRARWMAHPTAGPAGVARRVTALLADATRFGAFPFATLARHAFIAVALVRSLRTAEVVDDSEVDALLRAIPSVASEVSRDMALYAAGRLDGRELLAEYGHLRPSSYDITSPNYRSGLASYAPAGGGGPIPATPDPREAAALLDRRSAAIGRLLRARGFRATPEELRDYVLRAIPARERAKFELMKSVDDVLESIAEYGAALGLGREEMSHLPLSAILPATTDSPSAAQQTRLRRDVDFHAKRWSLTRAIRLPQLLCSPAELRCFRRESSAPNFVTAQRVVAPPTLLEGGGGADALAGRIVLIRAADPGYDWIFSHGIAGLVTQYGGVASHMAIRAAEFGLAAAIGCGEEAFERVARAGLIELDCAAGRLEVIG